MNNLYVEKAQVNRPYVSVQVPIPYELHMRIKNLNKKLSESGKKFVPQKSMVTGLESAMTGAQEFLKGNSPKQSLEAISELEDQGILLMDDHQSDNIQNRL